MDSNTSNNDFFDADGENRYVHVDPLHNDESIVGALMVVQNAGYINTSIREIWEGNLLRLLIQIIIFSITIFIIFRFFVFLPSAFFLFFQPNQSPGGKQK